MSALALVFQFLLTYVVLGNILALFCLRLVRNLSIDRPSVLFVSLGLAPGIVSLILYFCFLLLPGVFPFVYISIVLAIFVAMLALSWRDFPLLLETYKSLFGKPRHVSFAFVVRVAVAVITLGAVLFVLCTAVLFPIQGYDALGHATLGRMLFQDCSLEHFPLKSPLENGFFMNVLYPPGIHLLYAWSYLLQGSTASDIGVRMVAPMYVILTFLLLWRWGETLGRGVGLFAMFALATMPIYMHQAAGSSIDAMRMFFFFSSLFWVYQLTRHRSLPLLGIASFTLALAPFIHTIGALALPVAGGMYLLFAGEKPLIRRIGTGALLVSLAGVLGGFDYLRRFIVFGSWAPASLHIRWDISEVLANRGLDTTYNIIVHGVFRIFTNHQAYGIVAWLFLASLLLLFYEKYRQNPAFLFVILCSVLTAVLLWTAPSPAVPGWANGRFIMTIAPFLALCAGLFLNTLGHAWNSPIKQTLQTLQKVRRYEV